MGNKKDSKKPQVALSGTLGKRIRDLRQTKNLRILDLANMTELTSSMISQVERGMISPSIETLKKIADALNISIGYLFENDVNEVPAEDLSNDASNAADYINAGLNMREISPVVHEHQRKVLSPGNGVNFYLLNPNMDGPIEFIYNVYQPGSGTGVGLYSHAGVECGVILEGELMVNILDKTYHLKKGDSITFDSSKPHAKINEGTVPCTSIWANSPPHF